MKRLIALALCLLMVMPLIVACGGGQEEVTTVSTTAAIVTTTEPEQTTEEYDIHDNLPDTLNFGGRTLTIYSRGRSWFKDEVMVDTLNGDLINDAIFNRNAAVCERLNFKINNPTYDGSDSYHISEDIRAQVQSGSHDYDMFVNSTFSTIMYTGDNLFQDLAHLTYLDLSQPYWAQGFNEAASIGNAQYFASGAICLSMYRFMFATFFNKNMFDEYQIPYLYDVVNEGKWTIDYQYEITNSIYSDLNGNGVADQSDRFGVVINTDMIGVDAYWSAFKLPILIKNADNQLELHIDTERLSTAVDKLNHLAHGNEGAYPFIHLDADADQDQMAAMFAADQVATLALRLIHVESEDIRNMASKYGIVPMPKLDEDQDQYYSYDHDQVTSYAVPLTTVGDDLEMCGAIMEAMASESYRSVMPAYYELALKTKYVSDEESVKMLDLVVNSLYIDPGILYTKSVSSFHQNMRTWIGSNQNTVASLIKAGEKPILKQVEKLNTDMMKLQ